MTQELAIEEIQSAFSRALGATSKSRLSLIKLAGDISTRRYYRIQSDSRSFILQIAEPFESEEKNSFLQAQKLFSFAGVRVPQILECHPSSGMILMEDLSDEMLQSHKTQELYRESLQALAHWTQQAHPLNKKLNAHNYIHFSQHFDVEKLSFEMRHSDTHLFQKLLGQKENSFFHLTEENTRYLSERPQFLCHRDYHSRNIMIHKEHIAIIDFQDARMGPISYDLVSLLWDPYAQLDESFRKKSLEFWKEKTFNLEPQHFLLSEIKKAQHEIEIETERMKIQRLLKAAGSYASFYNTRQRKDYLNCIPYAANIAIGSLKTLKAMGAESPQDKELCRYLELQNWDKAVLA